MSQVSEMKRHTRNICISSVGKVNRFKCKVMLCGRKLSNAKPTLILNKNMMINTYALNSTRSNKN